jgi:hypothetical protein
MNREFRKYFIEFQEMLGIGNGASWHIGNWQLESVVSSQWSCQR